MALFRWGLWERRVVVVVEEGLQVQRCPGMVASLERGEGGKWWTGSGRGQGVCLKGLVVI